MWTKLPVRTRKSFFRPLNRALAFHTPPLDPTHVSVSSSVICLPFFSPSSLFPLHAGSCLPHRPTIPQIALIKSTITLRMLNQMVIFRSHLTWLIKSVEILSTALSIIISHPSALFLESLSSLKFQESSSRIPECPCLGFPNSKCWHIPESSPPSPSCLCPYPYSLAVSFTLLLSLSPEDFHFYIYSPDFSSELQTYNQLPTRHRHLDD